MSTFDGQSDRLPLAHPASSTRMPQILRRIGPYTLLSALEGTSNDAERPHHRSSSPNLGAGDLDR